MNESQRKSIKNWLNMLANGTAHRDDVAQFFEELIAETGEVEVFKMAPEIIKKIILEDIAVIEMGKRQVIGFAKSDETLDVTDRNRLVAAVLRAAGIFM